MCRYTGSTQAAASIAKQAAKDVQDLLLVTSIQVKSLRIPSQGLMLPMMLLWRSLLQPHVIYEIQAMWSKNGQYMLCLVIDAYIVAMTTLIAC